MEEPVRHHCRYCPDRPKGRVETREFARYLRHHQTRAEAALWAAIGKVDRRPQLGCRATRQVAIGPYVADFVFRKPRLVVEVDGGYHDNQREYDEQRESFIRDKGYRVIRFTNEEVLGSLSEVLSTIGRHLE